MTTSGPEGVTEAKVGWTSWMYAATVLFFAASWPFADFIGQNRFEAMPLSRLSVWVVVTFAVSFGAVVLLTRRDRSLLPRAAIVAAWAVTAFFHFNAVFDPQAGLVWDLPENLRPLVSLLVWVLVVAAVGRLLWKVSAIDAIRTFVILFFGFVWAAQMVTAVPEVVDRLGQEEVVLPAADDGPGGGSPFVDHPNVYFFLFDQYPRADVATEVLDVDIDPFLAELEDRGFWVGRSSYAAYPNTITSLPALFEQGYPFTSIEDLQVGVSGMTAPILGSADVIETFASEGYDYLYADAGFFFSAPCGGDRIDACLTPERDGLLSTESDLALLQRTPLSMVLPAPLRSSRPEAVLDRLDQERSGIDEPFFLFAHMMNPHEPLEYAADCSARSRPVEEPTTMEYAQEVRCLNEEIIRVVDRIQADDPTAVILMQSDHGTMFEVPWGASLDGWTADDLRQRYAVLDLRLGPDGCAPPPPGPQINANTFPWLLACLRNEAPAYLEPRAFLWDYRFDGELEEISDPFAAFGESPLATPADESPDATGTDGSPAATGTGGEEP